MKLHTSLPIVVVFAAFSCKSSSPSAPEPAHANVAADAAMTSAPEMATLRLGEPIAIERTTPLADVMSSPDSSKPVRVEGTITDVCRRKGCWLMVSDGEREMRVSVRKCGEVSVPTSAIGRSVAVVGVAEKKTIDEATARHYAEESGKDAAAIQGDQVVVSMTASGIEIH